MIPKLAIEALSLGDPPQGLGSYSLNLVSALAEDPGDMEYLFFIPETGMEYTGHLQDTAVQVVPCRTGGGKARRVLYQNLLLSGRIRSSGASLLHSTANLLPLGYRRRSMVTIHDLDFLVNPAHSPPARRRFFGMLTPSTIRRASVIITDSDYSARVISEKFPELPSRKIRVLPLGAPAMDHVSRENVEAVTDRYGLEEGYFLSVGTLEKRKNISQVLEAFYLYRQSYDRPARLVLAGQPGYGYEGILKAVSASPYRKSIVIPGYVPGEDLAALYAGASSLLLLSLAEGFGLPALEAMASGCPVIAARAGALPETGGDGAVFVSGESAEETAETMADLVADGPMRSGLVERGKENLSRFSWDEHAMKLKEIYRELTPD